MAGETHRTSLAIWDVPSTVVAGERFMVKVGAKSSAGCNLAGCGIEACDAAGAVIASGALGNARWPETDALYWTELSLTAPAQHGMASLSVRLDATSLVPPHRAASSQFSVVAVPPPEHTLTIQVVEQQSAGPVGDVDIRIGAYRATTAESGRAEVRLSKGRYDLHIWKVGYEAPPRSVDIAGDKLVEIEAVIVPEENADRAWRA